jgi:putative DNA primase/helicase
MIVDAAKAVPIEDEVARRGIKLAGRGERVGPCPVCGGRDRFSINTKKQIWNCRGCDKGGDVIALVQHLDGVDFKSATALLAGDERRPIRPTPKAQPPQDDDAANTTRALALWEEGSPIDGSLAEQYLRRRGLELPSDDEALRFYGGCPFGSGTNYPCMLALFRDIVTNEPRAIHRIAITTGGIAIGKKMLGPVKGAAVKLDASEHIGHPVTEDSPSARSAHGAIAAALAAAGNPTRI